MCLAIPAQVLELRTPDMAWVDLAGVRKEISVALLDTVAPGDYVIVHVGFALSKLDPEEAANTLALFANLTTSANAADAANAANSANSANADEIH